MSAGNSAYSPLPQSNSDSDCSSEEELHVSQGNRIVNRAAKFQSSKGEKTCNEQKNNVVNYNLLDHDGDVVVALNKLQSSPDEVSILKPDGGLEIFSTSRKICFVFSLLLCVFTTVAFLWILPCNVESCLSASNVKNYNFTWEENLPNLEIYGPISLVSDKEGNSNMLFLTRRPLSSEKNLFKNGLRCLKGEDGSLHWNFNLDEKPEDIDCKLIDINADGVNDCLIYGRNFLQAINPVSGKELWNILKSNKKEQKPFFRNFPLVIGDVDKDEVKDLLLSCSFASSDKKNQPGVDFKNYLIIISGKSGTIINNPLLIKSCSSIHNLMLENSSVLSYTCFNSDEKESFQRISFMDVYKTLKSTPTESVNLPKWDSLKQHVIHPDTVKVNGFRLVVENHGDCPEHCDATVVVTDERENSKNKTVYQFKKKNTFVMAPVALKTHKENGFILKLWKWDSKTENWSSESKNEINVFKSIFKNLTKRSKKVNYVLNSSRILDKAMLLESDWESQRKKRTATKVHKNRIGKSVSKSGVHNMRVISEIIVKIALDQSQAVVSNVTRDEVTQICEKSNLCRPSVYNHRHSVLVTPLCKNGNPKLITFNSKYVYENKETKKKLEPWLLQSTVRVFNI